MTLSLATLSLSPLISLCPRSLLSVSTPSSKAGAPYGCSHLILPCSPSSFLCPVLLPFEKVMTQAVKSAVPKHEGLSQNPTIYVKRQAW